MPVSQVNYHSEMKVSRKEAIAAKNSATQICQSTVTEALMGGPDIIKHTEQALSCSALLWRLAIIQNSISPNFLLPMPSILDSSDSKLHLTIMSLWI